MKKMISIFLFVLGTFACVVSAESTVELNLPAAVSDSLPWFAVREINDVSSPFTRTILERDALKSERTALVFFATWCNPCKDGIRKLAQSKAELENNKVKVILVNIGVREVDESKIRQWVNDLGAGAFKLVIDPFKVMTEGFGLLDKSGEIALPKTLVVDSKAKPLILFGQEGSDWPKILWKK